MSPSELDSRIQDLLSKVDWIFSALENVPDSRDVVVQVLRESFIDRLEKIGQEVPGEVDDDPDFLIVGFISNTAIFWQSPYYEFSTMRVPGLQGDSWLNYQLNNSPALRPKDFRNLVRALRDKGSSGAFDQWLHKDPAEVIFESMIMFVEKYLTKVKKRPIRLSPG